MASEERVLPEYYKTLKVKEGNYIPTGDYMTCGTDDPHAHLLPIKKIYDVNVDANYPYVDNSFKFKFFNFLYYFQARFVVDPLNRLRYGFRLRGMENLKKYKEQLKGGALTICNHVFRWDMCGILKVCGWRQLRFPIFRGQMAGKDRDRMVYTGGVPIPEKLSDLRHFYRAFDYYHEHGFWMHFFPEESRWQFYTPIRPFKKGAFIMAERYNVPIIPMAYTYRERKGILKFFGKEACVTLNVGEPIFPDPALKGQRSASIDDLRRRTHEACVRLAGIENNPWTYNQTEK